MVEISDSLRSLFSATIDEHDGTYRIEVPASEIALDALSADETYRVAILGAPSTEESSTEPQPSPMPAREPGGHPQSGPPVGEGEVREVTIETVGDQGDGIAKVDRGFVVIVPGAAPGDAPTVEIERVTETVAFARVVDQ